MNFPAPCRQPSFAGFIGVAREDITPPSGIYARNWGAAEQDVAEGIHRPLTLTSLTFQTNREAKPFVLVSADLGWWNNREDEELVRQGVMKALSLEPERVMVCLSHTHSGPSLNRDDANKPGGELIEPFLRELREKLVNTVKNALNDAARATLTWRYGRCDLAKNRDLNDPREERCLVGYNPSIPADDTLLVGRITGARGQILAAVVNYACHPTTLAWQNRLISPDYVGAMRELVEGQSNAPCLFLQGASGDLAPAEQYSGDPELADAHGRRLGHAVLSTLEAMLPPAAQLVFKGVVESGAALGIWEREPDELCSVLAADLIELGMPLKPLPSIVEIETARRTAADRVANERLWRQRGIRKIVGDGSTARIALSCWRIGDALLFGQPCEAYSQFQLLLRKHFAPRPVAVINIVNGYASYLPVRELYSRQIYSVAVSPFQAGACELMTERAIQLGTQLWGNTERKA